MVKNPLANAGDTRRTGSIPGLAGPPGGGHGTPVLPGESHGQRSLAGCSPLGSQRVGHALVMVRDRVIIACPAQMPITSWYLISDNFNLLCRFTMSGISFQV